MESGLVQQAVSTLQREKLLRLQLQAKCLWLQQQLDNESIPLEIRVRMAVEQKQLTMFSLQTEARQQLVNDSIGRVDFSCERRVKKVGRPDLRPGPDLERLLSRDKDQREKEQHNRFLDVVRTAHSQFKDMHQNRKKELAKINRAIVQYHKEREKRMRLEEDKQRRDRLKALREHNQEQYLQLVQNTKNERLTQLLQQTEEYIGHIGARVVTQREKAFQFKSAEEQEQERMRAATQSPDNQQSEALKYQKQKEYYAIAHRIQERVTSQPSLMQGGRLKDYQLEGLQWMVSLYNNGLNGILADEMGLGKTIQTIALVSYLVEVKRNRGPFLVIVPLSTLPNWQIEFGKWAPAINVVPYRGSKDALKKIEKTRLTDTSGFNCILTTYEMVLRSPFLRKRTWQYVIVDEGHRLKNSDCKLFRTLTTFTTRHRLLLTGTPLQNSLDELWALLNFLLPSIFSSCDTFEQWFNAPFQERGASQVDKFEMDEEESLLVINRLHQVLRPFVLRREKKDVENQLPEKKEHVVRCHISAWQNLLYNQIQNKALRTADGNRITFNTLNNTLVQLRKVCNHPFLINDQFDFTEEQLVRASGKFELLDRMLPKLLRTNHKVLIFSQMTRLLNLLEDYLDHRSIKFCRLDGSTKPEERGEVVKRFSAPDSDIFVFLLSTRAGGLGLNLQVADTVILYDSDWNPQQDLQAQDRAHRIGQKSEVRVFRFVTATPMEQSMYERATHKLDMDAKIIQAGKFNNRYTEEDRHEFLTQLLREQADASEVLDVPDCEMLNRLVARSDDEFTIFQQMDKDAETERLRKWREQGNTKPFPPRLMIEDDLPAWMTEQPLSYGSAPGMSSATQEDAAPKRRRTKVMYDDGLSDKQFDKLLDSGLLDKGVDEGLTATSIHKLHLERKRQKRQHPESDNSEEEDLVRGKRKRRKQTAPVVSADDWSPSDKE